MRFGVVAFTDGPGILFLRGSIPRLYDLALIDRGQVVGRELFVVAIAIRKAVGGARIVIVHIHRDLARRGVVQGDRFITVVGERSRSDCQA